MKHLRLVLKNMLFGGIYGVAITLFGSLILFSSISIFAGRFLEFVDQLQEDYHAPAILLTAYGLIIGIPAGYAKSFSSKRLNYFRCLVINAISATLGATIFGSPISLTGGSDRYFSALVILAILTGILIPIVETRLTFNQRTEEQNH